MKPVPRLITGFLICGMAFSACTCRSCGDEENPPAPRLTIPTARPTGIGNAGLPARPPVNLPIDPAPALPSPLPTLEATIPPVTPGEMALPDDFPSELPVLDGMKAFKQNPLPGNAKNVLFQSDKPAEQIFGQYSDQMQKTGWKQTQQYQTEHQSFLTFEKDKKQINLTISTDPKTGQRIVGVMYQDVEDLPFDEF